MSSPSVPDPDPRIGEAALKSAELGQDYLDFMRGQADVTTGWAEEDRARYQDTFLPLQEAYIERANQGPDYAGVESSVMRARADVTNAFESAQGQQRRQLAARGVNPASGASMEATRRGEVEQALGTVAAMNTTRLAERSRAEAEADMRETNAINLGSGLAVNPATAMGMGTSAMGSGFRGAIGGQQQMGNMLNNQYQNRMAAWQAESAQSNSLWGGIGQVAGAVMFSSKEYKTGRKKTRGALKALQEMPVQDYRYKDGIADGGAAPHTGPMAEDFHKATGGGDGKMIPLQDAIGVTMGAVQELSAKVDKLASRKRGPLSAA